MVYLYTILKVNNYLHFLLLIRKNKKKLILVYLYVKNKEKKRIIKNEKNNFIKIMKIELFSFLYHVIMNKSSAPRAKAINKVFKSS